MKFADETQLRPFKRKVEKEFTFEHQIYPKIGSHTTPRRRRLAQSTAHSSNNCHQNLQTHDMNYMKAQLPAKQSSLIKDPNTSEQSTIGYFARAARQDSKAW